MSKEWDVLVASGNYEHRRSLIRILEELPLNVISVSTFQQAEEVLSRQHIFAALLGSEAAGRVLQTIVEPHAVRKANAARGADDRGK